MSFNDPCELIVADALTRAGIKFTHESENKAQGLDFYLPEYDLLIEVKQFASERTADQLRGQVNVMLLQGMPACHAFANMICNSTKT